MKRLISFFILFAILTASFLTPALGSPAVDSTVAAELSLNCVSAILMESETSRCSRHQLPKS